MIVTEKELNKYTFKRVHYGKCCWIIDWPRAKGREDWKNNIATLAERAGHNLLFAHGTATVSDTQGNSRDLVPSSHPGDWRAVFLLYVDDIITGRIIAPPPEALFPDIKAVPVPKGLRDGFTPAELYDAKTDTAKPFIRKLRDVSRSELLRLDGDNTVVKNCGALHGHTTDLALFECACGRLIIAHKSVANGTKNDWPSCGCLDWSCKNLGYSGIRADTMRAAWREWCTMHLLKATPDAALHQALAFKGYNMDCDLPGFEDFWKWYFAEAKRTKQTFIQRIDPTKPFTMDNITLPTGERYTIDDPANGNHFKLGI